MVWLTQWDAVTSSTILFWSFKQHQTCVNATYLVPLPVKKMTAVAISNQLCCRYSANVYIITMSCLVWALEECSITAAPKAYDGSSP